MVTVTDKFKAGGVSHPEVAATTEGFFPKRDAPTGALVDDAVNSGMGRVVSAKSEVVSDERESLGGLVNWLEGRMGDFLGRLFDSRLDPEF